MSLVANEAPGRVCSVMTCHVEPSSANTPLLKHNQRETRGPGGTGTRTGTTGSGTGSGARKCTTASPGPSEEEQSPDVLF